ncbi:MAG: UDP-N-acetylmuramate dehydrogenase [Clostridia bacterium]|nr:UDP-N-acetylmuramate dehydrogenase [Clostridia bacterium]
MLTSILTNSKILKNESMSKHTSFKIGGNADILVKANNEKDIKSVLEISNKENIPIYVMGNGSNILVKDNGIRGIVLMICMDIYKIDKQENKAIVTAGAGVKLGGLAQELLKQEITGFEFASGIPGTIGGAIRMNAGAHGKEMKDIVVTTTYIDEYGNLKTISNKEQEFSYRNSVFSKNKWIIINTVLEFEYGTKEEIQEKMQEYARYRKEKQPITYPSAGSTFKRGEDFITAKLIDECGLKGYSIGGAKISEIHAGFIINTGNAKAEDVLKLVEYTRKKVYEKFNKTIELEIEVIGE